MNKRFYFLLFITVSSILYSYAQIGVESFRLLETDLTAITNDTQETDQNGEVAALIKVVTTQKDFTFDGGMLGIVRTIVKPGEYWVYVPRKLQKITISHPDLGILRDYFFPIPIDGGRTYELKLVTSRVKTVIEEDAGGGFLALKVAPASANVYVDDQARPLNAEGMLAMFLLYGEHTYRVEASGYKAENGKVNITSDETQTITIALSSIMAHLTLSVSMMDAEIWVNNEQKGIGKWSGTLAPGSYVAESRKEGHRPRRATLTLSEKEEKTITLPDPEPIIGRLRAESNPLDVEVWLDDKKIGTTPAIFGDILAGNHSVRFTKEGYLSKSVDVTIEEGMIATASVTLQKNTSTKNKEREDDETAKKTPLSTPKKKESSTSSVPLRNTRFYFGVHHETGNPSTAGGDVGAFLGGFNLEGSFDKAMGGDYNVTWYHLSDGVYTPFTMNYTPSSLISGSMGYNIPIGRRLRLTPRVGVKVLAVKGEDKIHSQKHSQKTYIFSGTVSLRADIYLTRMLSLYITPAYTIPLQKGETIRTLEENISKYPKWNSGVSLRAGISLNF